MVRDTGLTVVALLWGDWPRAGEYLANLHDGVARHLSGHRFVCMTDEPERVPPWIETLPLSVPDWPRNLRKMALYRPGNGLTGRILALDLDTVVTGPLGDMAGYSGRFCTLEDLWDPGLFGGAVIGFDAGTLAEELYEPLVRDINEVMSISGGSERHWFRHQMPGSDFLQRLYPGQIADAKPKATRKIIDAVPNGARLVCFHGKPRPHEVEDLPWMKRHWRTTTWRL